MGFPVSIFAPKSNDLEMLPVWRFSNDPEVDILSFQKPLLKCNIVFFGNPMKSIFYLLQDEYMYIYNI